MAVRLFCRSCAQTGTFLCVPLPLPTAVRPPHRNRTAQQMKHVAFGKPLRWNNRPCARFHLRQNVSFLRPVRLFRRCGKKPLVRASPKCITQTNTHSLTHRRLIYPRRVKTPAASPWRLKPLVLAVLRILLPIFATKNRSYGLFQIFWKY